MGQRDFAFLFAFDLLELDGVDVRLEPIEVRKATLASIVRKSLPGVRLNEHMAHPEAICGRAAEAANANASGSTCRSQKSHPGGFAR
jgi:ATP-dependent DNA ligase